ncbi:hypothetical protein Tco_0851110 [Tanacetum coccineum]
MKEFTTNDKANYYSRITSIMVNGKRAYELKGKFLDDLRDNAFNGTNGEDTVEHIEYFLKIVAPLTCRINDHRGVANKEFSDPEKANNNDEQETAEIFRIETNLFDYETLLTKTYEEYEDRLNDELEEPWSEDGIPYEICDHICEPFRFKNGKAKWPTYNSNEDGFCNGRELPGMVRVGYMTYFQDYEWYNELADGNLKEEALKQKSIYERSWGNASQKEHEDEERCELFDDKERPVCTIRRFKMIKYSFGEDEEYVAVKENEYDDLMNTSKEAIHAYQEIFRMIDEGWMVTRVG